MGQEVESKTEGSIFDHFTGQYELSKTLRFELKPVGETTKQLEFGEVIKNDIHIAEQYKLAKPLFDNLHREFVKEALETASISDQLITRFVSAFVDYKKLSKLESSNSSLKETQAWQEAQTDFRKAIVGLFNKTGNRWKDRYAGQPFTNKEGKSKSIRFKKSGHAILTEAGILGALLARHPEHRDTLITFDKFFTYFTRFSETRENLYKSDGKSTAIATRISDNFQIFLQNADIFNKFHLSLSDLQLSQDEIDGFKAEHYIHYLLQVNIDTYNKQIIGALNNRMKQLRDTRQAQTGFKKSQYPLLKTLQKQILGEDDRETLFLEITNDNALELLQQFVSLTADRLANFRQLVSRLASGEYSDGYDGIYFTNKAINTIARRWLVNAYDFEISLPQKKKTKTDADGPKLHSFISLGDIKKVLEEDIAHNNLAHNIFKEEFYAKIDFTGKESHWQRFLAIFGYEAEKLFSKENKTGTSYDLSLLAIQDLITNETSFSKKSHLIETIKNFADSANNIVAVSKYFSISTKKDTQKPTFVNAEFYNDYDTTTKDFNFSKYYEAFRNFITKKPSEERKIKLNFGTGNLLSGWAQNYDQYGAVLFRRRPDGCENNIYYLGIIRSTLSESDVLKMRDSAIAQLPAEQMVYAFQKMDFKNFPRMFINSSGSKPASAIAKHKLPVHMVWDEYQSYKNLSDKERNEYLKNHPDFRTRLIEYFIVCLPHHESLAYFRDKIMAVLKPAANYKNLTDFYNDVEKICYELKPMPIDFDALKEFVDEGKIYLFQIYNKDFPLDETVGKSVFGEAFAPEEAWRARQLKKQDQQQGKDNMHTLYFKALFDNQLNKDMLPRLAGNAELFFGQKAEKPQAEPDRNFTPHQRYYRDKIYLHMPILLNTTSASTNINTLVRDALKHSNKTHVIGIDRGEKHLLYYSVVNQQGEIVEQASLNTLEIDGKEHDFYKELQKREIKLRENRQNWQQVAQIKDLKRGYISHVIYKICRLVEKYDAIIVMENLNMRFKQVRGGVERSVYQQFEKALIDKLGYLTFKDRDPTSPGGTLNGYQLAAKFESFEQLGDQSGIIFYTQAEYTSATDPLTGFRKSIYIKNSAPTPEIIEAFKKIRIGWDSDLQSYFFEYNQADFTKKKQRSNGQLWRLYADVCRVKRFKSNGHWQHEFANPNDMLKDLFRIWNFDSVSDGIEATLHAKDEAGELKGKKRFDGDEREFYKSLVFIFNLVLQLRNNTPRKYKDSDATLLEDVDFIASPIKPFFRTSFTTRGEYHPAHLASFESRIKMSDTVARQKLINDFNGDANGAYNIARKGIIILEKIKEDRKNLYVSISDWDERTTSMFKS